MTLYAKDKSFSAGWMIGGAVVMFIANLFLGTALAVLEVTSIWVLAGAACASFLIGGFMIGWKSEGQTIIEAGMAAALASGAAIMIVFVRSRGSSLEPLSLVIGTAPPFLCGLLGGFLGEKVQGDSVEVQD